MDLSIIIPCFNEVENISKIREELFPIAAELAKDYSMEIIFVDDGSSDGTWRTLNDTFGNGNNATIEIKFERHLVNQGLGAAIRTGFKAASGEILLTTDSDGTYKFSEIPHIISYLTSDVDMVTASPYHPAGAVVGVPGYRLILSKGSSLIYRILTNWHLHTYTALFRIYRRRVIQNVPFEANGFLAGTELMVKAILAGYTVAEYPTALHSRVFGTSKAKLVRTILAHLRFQGRVLLYRLKLKTFVSARQSTAGGTN